MAFDANLVLFDGSEAITASNPTSTTRTNGYAVLDIKETAAKGMVAALIVAVKGSMGDTDYVIGTIQACDTEDFSTGEVERLASFGGATHTEHTFGAECPIIILRRIATKKRYIRFCGNLSGTAPTTLYVLLSPYPFGTL